MKKPLYFDTHTSYHPFQDALNIYKKTPPVHFRNPLFYDRASVQKTLIGEIKELFGAQEYHLIFKDNLKSAFDKLAIVHYTKKIFNSGKIDVIVDTKELKACFDAFGIFGVKTHLLSPDQKGLITKEKLIESLTSRTSLVSVTWADPITGIVQPVEALAKICEEKGIDFHVDMTHMVGKKYFSLKDLGASYVTFDALGFYGAFSISGFFLREDIETFEPCFDRQSYELESLKSQLLNVGERIDDLHLEGARLTKLLEKKILHLIPGAYTLFNNVEKLPNVVVIEFPFISSEIMLYYLCQENLFAASFLKSALSFTIPYFCEPGDIEEASLRILAAYQRALSLSKGVF